MIYIEDKYDHEAKKLVKWDVLRNKYPFASIIDVTSASPSHFKKFSPFYPHGNIPVPYSPGWSSFSVEGIWQGLKVFECSGMDTRLFYNSTMRNLKRPSKKGNRVLGHRQGVHGSLFKLMNIAEARRQIYLPSYLWVLEHNLADLVEELKHQAETLDIVLLDFNTGIDIEDPTTALSHAGLIKAYIEGKYPEFNRDGLYELPEDPELENVFSEGLWVSHDQYGAGEIVKLESFHAQVQFDKEKKDIDLYSERLVPLDPAESFVYQNVKLKKIQDKDELEVVGCANALLSKVQIPEQLCINGQSYPVTTIGKAAFSNMKRLTDVTIPSSVTAIHPHAFAGSDDIRQVRTETSRTESATFVVNAAGRWGAMADTAKKQTAIPFEYDDIHLYAGRAVAKQTIPFRYFLVCKHKKWGLLSKQGYQLIPCIYDSLTPKETDGLLVGFEFRLNQETGTINAKGEQV